MTAGAGEIATVGEDAAGDATMAGDGDADGTSPAGTKMGDGVAV